MKTRYEPYYLSSTEGATILRGLEALPDEDRAALKEMATRLSFDIRNFGPDSAVVVLWAIGRLMQRTGCWR